MPKQPIYSSQFNLSELIDRLQLAHPTYPQHTLLLVNISHQTLYHVSAGELITTCSISSGLNGTGSQNGSGKTPLGVHCIQEKFGEGAALGTIFKGRVNTRQVAHLLTDKDAISDSDNITSRILWLSGLEPTHNQGGDVDTYQRYIYIHGTDEEGRLGQPASHGCIRMANRDIIELFDQVDVKTLVYIYID